jgi:glycosyltransferase involved in cell wall biosynthesis
MNILFLTQFYTPEPEPIPHQLAQGMVRRGHRVTVMTGFPNYPNGRIFKGYRQRPFHEEEIDGVRVIRFPLFPDRSNSVLRRSAYYLSSTASTLALGAALCGSVDAIWVYHTYTLGLSAWWIGRVRGAPYVFNVQDMYPESLASTGLGSQPRVLAVVNRLAEYVYDRATAVSVISPGFKENLVEKGVPTEKLTYIPNWANEQIYRPVKPDPELARHYGFSDRFSVVYGGNFGPPQGLSNVINAADILKGNENIEFVLIGGGLEENALRKRVKDRNLTNVRFVERQPEAAMPSLFALADCLLIHLIEDPLFAITIPSKTQAYLACGIPIIASLSGNAADIISRAGAGVSCLPSNPRDLARAVLALATLSEQQRMQMGRDGRRYFEEHFAMEQVHDRYSVFFEEVARRGSHVNGA